MGARRQSKRSGRSVPGVVDRMCVVSEEEFGSMANSSHSRLFSLCLPDLHAHAGSQAGIRCAREV
jgi:hypothetical protein